MTSPIIPAFFAQKPTEEEQAAQEIQRKGSAFLDPGDDKFVVGIPQQFKFLNPGDTAIDTTAADLRARGDAFQTAVSRAIGQAQNLLAPDALLTVQSVDVTRQPFDLAERERRGVDLLEPLTLDDIITNSARAGLRIPLNPAQYEIRPLTAPIGTGVVGGTIRDAINITRQLRNDPANTVLGFLYAPAIITAGAMNEFIQFGALPSELPVPIGLPGSGFGTRIIDIDELRSKFIEIVGPMSHSEAEEARRAFLGLLAATVVGMGLGRGLGRGAPRGLVVSTRAKLASRFGATFAEAEIAGEVLATRLQAVSALSAFGVFGSEEDQRLQNAVAFALSSIPLGISHAALAAIGRFSVNITRTRQAASFIANLRAARPLDATTAPIPSIADTGAVPMGRRVSAERLAELAGPGPQVVTRNGVSTLEVRTSPDFVPRFTEEEAANLAVDRQAAEQARGTIGPEPTVPETPAARAEERTRIRMRIEEIADRRAGERRRAEERRAEEEIPEVELSEEMLRLAEDQLRMPETSAEAVERGMVTLTDVVENTFAELFDFREAAPEFARRIADAPNILAVRAIVEEVAAQSTLTGEARVEFVTRATDRLFSSKEAAEKRGTPRGVPRRAGERRGAEEQPAPTPEEIATAEVITMTPGELEAAAAASRLEQNRIDVEILGPELAAEYSRMLRQENSMSLEIADRAAARRQEIESQLTTEQQNALFGIREDIFGLDVFNAEELTTLSKAAANFAATVVVDGKPVGPLADANIGFLIRSLATEVTGGAKSGARGAESIIRGRGILQELTRRGFGARKVSGLLVERHMKDTGSLESTSAKFIEDRVRELSAESRKIASVPHRMENLEPVVPAEIAADLANWLQNNADAIQTLIDQAKLNENQTVVISGMEVPAEILASVREKLGPDFRVAVHPRADGTFDIAIGGKGSPLEVKRNFDQFVQQGFMEGERVSFNGYDHEYVGMDGENVLLRIAGTDRTFRADAGAIRRVKRVESINEFDKVANTQRGLPERAAMRINSAQISQRYGFIGEHIGDIIHRMSEDIKFIKGGFEFVLEKVDRAIESLTSEFGFEREVNQQVSTNTLVKANPTLTTEQMREVLIARDATRTVTENSETLLPSELNELNRLKLLGRDYADAHRTINPVNRVQRLANEAAIAYGEFRFQAALEALRELKTELDKGRDNWEQVTRESDTVSPRDALQDIFTKEEMAVYDNLFPEVQPQTADIMQAIKDTQDNVRQELATNGYELERSVAGDWIVRDRLTGREQYRGPIEGAREFNNRSGQAEGVVMDAGSPIDPNVPGSIASPPPGGGRWNEPFPADPKSWREGLANLFTAGAAYWSPMKDFFAAIDGIFGTNTLTEIFLKTQRTVEVSAARSRPHLLQAQELQKRMDELKLTPRQREQITEYIEAMSEAELRGSHKDGLGPLRGRSASPGEISAADLIISLNVDTKRVFNYLRQRDAAIGAEAKRQGVEIQDLAGDVIKNIDDGIKNNLKMNDPNELVVASLFEMIKTEDLNTLSLYVVNRIAEAHRNKAPNRAEYAVRENLTTEQIKLANEIEAIYDAIAKIEDVPISDARLIRGYTAHYAQQRTADPVNAYLNQKGTNPELKFVNGLIRTGEIDAYNLDPIPNLARYIRGAFNSVEFNKAWNEASRFAQTLGDPLARKIANDYLNGVRGNPPASQRWTQKLVDQTFKNAGFDLSINVRRDLVNTYMAMVNAAFMGWRPGLAVRDMMQWVFFHYSRYGDGIIGHQRTKNAIKAALNARGEGVKLMREAGDLPTIGIIEFDTPDARLLGDLTRSQATRTMLSNIISKFPQFMRWSSEQGLKGSFQRNAYEFAYSGTLLESRQFVGDALKRLVNGDLTKKEAYESIKLRSFNRATRTEFDRLVTEGDFTTATELLSRQSAREMLAEYGKANSPWGWNTNTGRLISHYGTWSSNATQFMLGGLSRGNKKDMMGFATRFAMTQSALFIAGRGFGLDFGRWFTLPGMFFTGGPAIQTAELIVMAMTGSETDANQARGRLMQLFPDVNWNNPSNSDIRTMFFPGSYMMGDLLKSLQEARTGGGFIKSGARAISIPIDAKNSVFFEGGEFFQ
jgi:hypothetical protein